MHLWSRVLTLCLCGLLAACGPKPPLRLGFIGGLTDRNADNGQAGLMAVKMAVDEFNRAGGVDGRMLELLAKDDAQDPTVAARSTQELVDAGVVAVIGPFTSGMAKVIVPITGQAEVFQVSPTITSMDFYGQDDNLFRINRTTRDNAQEYAQALTARGLQRAAVAYDTRNRNFTESWLREFAVAMEERGASVAASVPYESAGTADFAGTVQRMRAAQPDVLFFISGALDVARLAQEARRQAPALPIAASEWAATEQLLELGGPVVEGLMIIQNFDREDSSPRYRAFSDAFYQRYQRQPGYSSVASYDAATVVLTSLKVQRRDETLKQAALRLASFVGLQQTMRFDANGDTQRKVVFTGVEGGRYVRLAAP